MNNNFLNNFTSEKGTHLFNFLDRWLDGYQKTSGLPGLIVSMQINNHIYNKATGYSNIKKGKLLKPGQNFFIASMSKMFTSCLVHILEKDKIININTPVSKYLSNYSCDSVFKQITINDLLSHKAGVIRDEDSEGFWSLQTSFPDRKRLIATLKKARVLSPKSKEFKYSNFGYALIGLILEEVTNVNYRKLCYDNIIEPLKLKNTYFYGDRNNDKNLITGYSPIFKRNLIREPLKAVDAKTYAPATGLVSNSTDLFKFSDYLKFSQQTFLINKIKKKLYKKQASIEEQERDYCSGFIRYNTSKNKLWGHSGEYIGCSSRLMFDPSGSFKLIVASNMSGSPTKVLSYGILKTLEKFSTTKETKTELRQFESSFSGLFGTYSTLALGKSLYISNTDSTSPIENLIEIKKKAKIFYIFKSPRFYALGEKVTFKNNKKNNKLQIKIGGVLK